MKETGYEVPKNMEYLLDSTVPKNIIFISAMAIVVILAVMFFLILYIRKRQKGPMFALFGGISIYLIFCYFGVNALINLIFAYPLKSLADNKATIILVASVVAAALPIGGRLLTMRLFGFGYNKIKDRLSFGVGIMTTEAVKTVVNLFLMIVSCAAINITGAREMLDGATAETGAVLLESINNMVNYDISLIFIQTIDTVAYMFFHVAVTLPLFAAYQGKISKSWWGYTFGVWFVIELFVYLYSQNVINGAVKNITTVILVAVTVYAAIRIYNKFYKSEEEEIKKANAPVQKKMPKFENLSKL